MATRRELEQQMEELKQLLRETEELLLKAFVRAEDLVSLQTEFDALKVKAATLKLESRRQASFQPTGTAAPPNLPLFYNASRSR
ncbi:MAG TPA: hypothetical protein VHI52_10900 [Verrucomicrobiae bacterium]|nr:hypothetical protein [Verrucomicrobiae bacterium]